MSWALEHLQILIGVAAAIAYFLNRARAEKSDAETPRGESETDRAERTRRLQEEIRRKIAERRAEAGEASGPVTASGSPARTRERVPPLVRPPAEVRPVDPFGGPKPLGRLMRELQEAAQKEFDPAAEERRQEEEAAAHRAVLARQEKLAEEMRALEAARVAEQKRAAELVKTRREERATASRGATGLGSLSEQLRDPRELRRAFVLREVLGAPVALR